MVITTTTKATRKIRVDREAMKRLEEAEIESLCVACLQKLYGRVVRGCHEKCYRATQRAIERGDFTEEDRIAQCKLLACEAGGRKPSNPVTLEAKS